VLDQYGAEPFEQQQFRTAGVVCTIRFSRFSIPANIHYCTSIKNL